MGVAAAFMTIAFACVVLRCYVRLHLVKAFGKDDALMVVAMLFYLMFCGCMIGGAIYGTGKHFAVLTPHQRVTAMEYWWLCEIAYCMSSVALKMSICFFLLRITVRRIHNWILYTVMFLTVISCIVFMFLMLLQCRPLDYFWTRVNLVDPNIHGECMNIHIIIAMTYVYSTFAALCDFTVGIMPIFLVRKMNMNRQAKLALAGILGMACVASCAVIIRMPFVKTFADPDFLYATVEIALWSNIEIGLGISAGSLATLRPLLRKLRGSYGSKYYSESRATRGRLSSSRLQRMSRDRSGVPLGSLDQDAGHSSDDRPALRADKVGTTVTTIECNKKGSWMDDSSRNTSEERLAGVGPGSRPSHGSLHDGAPGLGLSIYRTVEVTTAMSPV